MKKLLTAAALAALVGGAAQAASFQFQIGDIDGFGGNPLADSRDAAEIASTNGAQETDWGDTPFGREIFQVDMTFNIGSFASITSMVLEMYTYGIQSNDNDANTNEFGEDGLLFEGDLVSEYFAGVDQGGNGEGLVSGAISAGLFGNAADGVAEFSVLLNSFAGTGAANAEPANFDYFILTVEGERANVIPLPAGLPLMLGGLGMLGLWRRRQTKS